MESCTPPHPFLLGIIMVKHKKTLRDTLIYGLRDKLYFSASGKETKKLSLYHLCNINYITNLKNNQFDQLQFMSDLLKEEYVGIQFPYDP